MSTIAFIGLGIMGSPMAVHLAKAGHKVVGYDRSPEAVAALVAQAFLTAGSPSTKNHTGRNASAAWRLAGRDELLQ